MTNQSKKNLYTLCECSVLIALAVVLSWVEIQLGPNGGSINFTMLPILILAYRHGILWGVSSGMVFGFIKCLIGGGIGWGLPSILLDYVLAYGAVGLAGIFKGKSWAIELTSFIGCFARYIIHFISGVTIYMITAPEEVTWFGEIANPVLYSTLYNLVYMLPSSVVCIVLMALLRPVLKRMEKMFNK